MASLKERIKKLEQNAHVHKDNQDIKWAKNGKSILSVVQHSPVAEENEGGGDTYEGMFKCTPGDNEGDVVISAGIAQVNNYIFDINQTTITVAGEGYIIFEAIYNSGSITYSFKTVSTISYSQNTARIIIASYVLDNGSLSLIQQQHGAIQTFTFGDC